MLIVSIHHCGNNFIISWKSWQTKNKIFNSWCILDIIWIIISYYDDPWKEDEIDSDKAKGRVYTMVWTHGYAKVKTGGFTKVRTGEYTKVFFFFCSSQNCWSFGELVLKTWSLCFSIGLFWQWGKKMFNLLKFDRSCVNNFSFCYFMPGHVYSIQHYMIKFLNDWQ